jgi:copper transport protein
MFLAVMAAVGLFVMRLLTVRPLVRDVDGVRLRALSVAFTVAAVVGLIAIPVYLDFSTANDTLRSVFDLSAPAPLFRVTAFGRAIVDLEVCFALFCLAAGIALWANRPERARRSIAELIAPYGALLAAAAALIIPGAAGHAAQTSLRGLTLLFDWLHTASGSVWLGGLVGLLVLWFSVSARERVAALSVTCPVSRTSPSCPSSCSARPASGEAINHMPAVNALWETS